MAPIKPKRSATGMKVPGLISPRRGWFQRIRASAPVICPLGAASCLFLFWQAFVVHWHLFVGWTVLGLLIYFGYGMRHSKLNTPSA